MSQTPIELKASELTADGGFFCPSARAGMTLWNTHPRVYLDVASSGEARCPYCSTVYRLQAGEVLAHGH